MAVAVFRTEQKNIGFVTSSFLDDDLGFLIDLENHFSAVSEGGDSLVELVAKDDPFVRRRVFNIEVEDFHTYDVGKHGLWAHNTNCGPSRPLQRHPLSIASFPRLTPTERQPSCFPHRPDTTRLISSNCVCRPSCSIRIKCPSLSERIGLISGPSSGRARSRHTILLP